MVENHLVVYATDHIYCSQELLIAVEQERALRRHKTQAAQMYHRPSVEEYGFDRVSVLHSMIKK